MKNCNCDKKIRSGCSKVFVDKQCNLYINDTSLTINYVYVFIIKHSTYTTQDEPVVFIKSEDMDEIKTDYKGDGLYTILKLTVPKDSSAMYYYEDEQFYKEGAVVELQELIDVNPEVSGIVHEYIYYFSTCSLRKCFVSLAQDIFKNTSSICEKAIIDPLTIQRRDLIWSALNVIEYLADLEQFDEAKRLLYEITQCNGLCPPNKLNNCGCNL